MIAPLDYEVSHEYYITVEATDGGSPPLSDMATVNINLTDVNDNRPAFSQDVYTAVVSEDAELGKAVIAVSVASPHGGGGVRVPRAPPRHQFRYPILVSVSVHPLFCFFPKLGSVPYSLKSFSSILPAANHHLVEQLNREQGSSSSELLSPPQ